MALDDKRQVTPDTLFRIASMTKPFTATAILKLHETGLVALDMPVNEYLDWFNIERPTSTGGNPVTVRQLLTHTSGLPRDSSLTDFSRNFQPGRSDAIAAIPGQRLQSVPGTVYRYSNLGYGILGEIIAVVSGKTYEDYLQQDVLLPLGMSTTLVHPTREHSTAWGHGPRRLDGSRSKAEFWELGFATPAGGIAASVNDLGKFVLLQLAPYVDSKPALLPHESIRESHRVQHHVDPDRGGSGFAWGVDIENRRHLIYHGGELPDQSSFLIIDLQAGIGVILLTNAQDVDTETLARELLEKVHTAISN